MSASSSLPSPTGQAAQLAEPRPANNDGDSRANAGLRAHEQDDAKQPAQSSAHVSPATRLYRHALESIFAMLELQDLSHVLAVSREWIATVRSMKPIGATIDRDEEQLKRQGKVFCPLPSIDSLVASPLIRHIAAIHVKDRDSLATSLTRASLAVLAQRAPNLTSLWCTVAPKPRAPWCLPAKLVSLQLQLSQRLSAADTNALFTCVSALPALERVHLSRAEDGWVDGVDFSLLAAAPALKDLTFRYADYGAPDLSDAEVHQIRTSLGHLRRVCIAQMSAGTLARFLHPPVTLQWQEINPVWLDELTEGLLVKLPTLTTLHLILTEDRPHVDFLSQLPQLQALTLSSNKMGAEGSFYVPPAAMLGSLLLCTGLTKLTLCCGFNSAQWAVLFAKLTSLTQVSIIGDLESLQCFASGPITQSLEELRIAQLSLPPSELVHLPALHRLRSLRLDRCFSRPLNASTLDLFSPPTALCPLLTDFACRCTESYSSPFVERKGCSFEWTQTRLTR